MAAFQGRGETLTHMYTSERDSFTYPSSPPAFSRGSDASPRLNLDPAQDEIIARGLFLFFSAA